MSNPVEFTSGGYLKRLSPSLSPEGGRVWEVRKDGAILATDLAPGIWSVARPDFLLPDFFQVILSGHTSTFPLGEGYEARLADGGLDYQAAFHLAPTPPEMGEENSPNFSETSVDVRLRAQQWPSVASYEVQWRRREEASAVWQTLFSAATATGQVSTLAGLTLPVTPATQSLVSLRTVATLTDGVQHISREVPGYAKSTKPRVANISLRSTVDGGAPGGLFHGHFTLSWDFGTDSPDASVEQGSWQITLSPSSGETVMGTLSATGTGEISSQMLAQAVLLSDVPDSTFLSATVRVADTRGYSSETYQQFVQVFWEEGAGGNLTPPTLSAVFGGLDITLPSLILTSYSPTPEMWPFMTLQYAVSQAGPWINYANAQQPPAVLQPLQTIGVTALLVGSQDPASLWWRARQHRAPQAGNAGGIVFTSAPTRLHTGSDGDDGDGADLLPPGVPGRVSFDNPGGTTHTIVVRPDAYPANTRNLKLWGKKFGDADFSLVAHNLLPNSRTARSGLALDTEYIYELEATNNYQGATSRRGPQAGIITNLSDQGSDAAKPERPSKPSGQKRGGEATLSFTAWPALAVTVYLRQDGVPIHAFVKTDARAFVATGLLDYQTYRFTLVAENDAGQSAESEPLDLVMVADDITQAWVYPVAHSTVFGRFGLVADVSATGGLSATNPVTMRVNGGLLSGVKHQDGTARFSRLYDARQADVMGPMVFTLSARNAAGLPSLPLDLPVMLANTIAHLTHYEHAAFVEPSGKLLSTMVLATIRDESEPRQWIDAFVSSPGKGGELAYDDYAAMEAELRRWQLIALDDVFTLLGSRSAAQDGKTTYAPPTERMELVLRFTPPRLETRYPTGSQGGRRARQVALDRIELLTHGVAKVFEASGDGVKLLLDLSTRGMGESTDARRWRDDKIVAIQGSTVRVCEIDRSSSDWLVVIPDEAKPPVAVEVVGNAFYLAYADDSGSTFWKHDGTDPIAVLSIPQRITLMRQSEKTIAFATSDFGLYFFDTAAATAEAKLLWQHTAAIVDVLFDGDDVTGFCDADRVWQLVDGVPVLVADPTAQLQCLGTYHGLGSAPRLTAGVDAPQVYTLDEAGAFVPTWSMGHGATGVRGLGRLVLTYVPASGDPLKGGEPAVESEVLVVLVDTETPGGDQAERLGYVAFIEKSKRTTESSTLTGGIARFVLVPENQKVKTA